jgi:hypothetical protein
MRNTAKKQRRGRELHREQDKTEAISGIEVHSAARLQSMLCRSTTYSAHQARITHQRFINRGIEKMGKIGGVVGRPRL